MKTNQGIIQLIIIVLLSVIILSLLGVSLRALFTDKTLLENVAFLWKFLGHVWGTYGEPYIQSWWQYIQEKN